jgi:hypothetical protein
MESPKESKEFHKESKDSRSPRMLNIENTYPTEQEALLDFIIGSSFLVFFIPFLIVINFQNENHNYSFTSYALLAPAYFGAMNVLSLFIQKYFNLSLWNRFIIISILSSIIVISYVFLFNIYPLNSYREKLSYIIFNISLHLFIYISIIYNITNYLQDQNNDK